MQDTQTGEIIDVQPAEAEYLLGIIESLFDHYFELPEKLRLNKEAINAKLKAAGKKEMKF